MYCFCAWDKRQGHFQGARVTVCHTLLSPRATLAMCQPGFLLNGGVQTTEIQRRISRAGRVFPGLLAQGLGAVPAPDWPGSLLISGDVSPLSMFCWHGGSVAGLGRGAVQCCAVL